MAVTDGNDQIKLVASDLDGTLLLNWTPTPRPEVFPLIEELDRRGVIFMAASGRQYASLRWLFAPVADRIAYLCENGSLVMYRGEVLATKTMPRDLALDMVHEMAQMPGCEPFVSGLSRCYLLRGDDALLYHLGQVTHNDCRLVDSFDEIDEPILKVAYRAPEDKMSDMGKHFAAAYGDKVSIVTSGTVWMDITMPGVNKGTALADFSAATGIAPAGMLAFGDAPNDTQMLEYVGHPYLVNSCAPNMRGLNDRIRYCETVEDELCRLLA